MKLTISLDEDEVKILKRRAKKNLLTLREQVEDIIRRSCIMSRTGYRKFKVDDKLVAVFSRERRGRKKKKKAKKRKKSKKKKK